MSASDALYTDRGASGARTSRPEFDKALAALHEGDTLVITTLDRLGRSTVNILDLSTEFHDQGIDLRVLNLGGDNVDTGAPMGGMVVTVMAALAQMELEIKRERITDSVSNAGRLIDGGEPATHVARDLGMSRATLYRRIAEIEAQQWIGTRS